jgi:PAS domain S-box-containing protein
MSDQASPAGRAEREHHRALVEQIDVGLYRTDAARRLEHVDDRYLALLGCTADEVAGWGWLERVHASDRARVEGGARAAAERRVGWADEFRVGTGRRVRCTVQPLRTPAGDVDGFLGTAVDVTAPRAVEAELHRAEAALAAQQAAAATGERLGALLAGLSAVVWERDAATGRLAFLTDRVQHLLGVPARRFHDEPDLWARLVHPEDRAAVEAAVRSGAEEELDLTYRMRTVDGEVRWVRDVVHLVRDGAGRPARLLGVATDVTAQRRAATDAAVLARATEAQVGTGALDDRLDGLLHDVAPVFGDVAMVALLGPDGLLAVRAAAAPGRPDAVAAARAVAPRPLGPGLRAGHLAGEPFVLDGDRPAPVLVVPLLARGRVLGHLAFAALDRPRTWDGADRALAGELGGRVAALVADERAATLAARLSRFHAALARADTPVEVAEVLARTLAEAFGATGQAVFARHPDEDVLRLVHAVGQPPATVERMRTLGLHQPTPVTDAARSGEAVWLGDDAAWEREYPHLTAADRAGVRAACTHPMRAGGRVVAVLAAGFATPRDFPPDEREAVAVVVAQGAHAFRRAVADEQHRGTTETLQHALLPAVPPALDDLAVATRYLPGVTGVQAGGDWFDVVPVGPRRTAVVVGDVVGQGAGAAAVMGQLRSALAGALLLVDGPAAALAHLDRFAARVPGARASTAVCVEIDSAAGRVRWTCAGHPPPLVLRRDGSAAFLDGGAAPLLGVPGLPGRSAEGTADVAPGDTVVLYTDGLVERRGDPVDDGLDRLLRAAVALAGAGPAALVAGLIDAALPGGAAHDDVALVAARLVPPPLRRHRPAELREVPAARHAVRRWAVDTGLAVTDAEDLELTVGEAVANAVEHAYPDGPGEFRCSVARRGTGDAVDVEVADDGAWRPPPADRGFRGRGLEIIERLALSSSVDRGPAGTTVRFTLALTAR